MNGPCSHSTTATPSPSCFPLWALMLLPAKAQNMNMPHSSAHKWGFAKEAWQKADFSPSPDQRGTTDLFFLHSHLKWHEWSGCNTEVQLHQPCPFSTWVQIHVHPSPCPDPAQPTGLQEHTLEGILMTWTRAELPLLAAVLVICWLSKAYSGFFFSLDRR